MEREAFILEAKRTPFGKRNGSLSGVHPVDLLANLTSRLLKDTGISSSNVDEFITGCVDQIGEQGGNVSRNAWLSSGSDESVPCCTVDKQCGSGLQAIHYAYSEVKAGIENLILAGGVENMSRVPIYSNLLAQGSPKTRNLVERYNLTADWFSQHMAAEKVAEKFGISRAQLDQYSLESHQRALKSHDLISKELYPVETGEPGRVLSEDEGVRKDTSIEKLSALRTISPDFKLITAGNASQISDGASLSVIASQQFIDNNKIKPKARIVAAASVGVDPILMLHGVIPATFKVLERAGMKLDDIDLFEVNEAFASVPLAWVKGTGVETDRLNVNGGAVAIGHPLGATGSRLIGTLINTLKARGKRHGLVAICEGGGMANSMIIEVI